MVCGPPLFSTEPCDVRMWLVDPELMCRAHLLGEHRELHTFIGALNAGHSVRGYIERGLLEPASLWWRHAKLVQEMLQRGYRHHSPLPELQQCSVAVGRMIERGDRIVDREASLQELLRRCPRCRERAQERGIYVKVK
jgi:hypothetical protein